MKESHSLLEMIPSDKSAAALRGLFAALERADIAAVVFDPDEKLVICTEAFLVINADLREHMVPGAEFRELLVYAAGRRVLDTESGKTWVSERYDRFIDPPEAFEEQHANGRWYRLQDIRTEDGYYIGLRQDITDERTAVDAKDQAEKRFSQLAELASDFFWEMDTDLRFSRFFGAGSEKAYLEALGKERWENATERDLQDTKKWVDHQALLEARQRFTDFEFELRMEPPIWSRVSGEPVFDDNNEFAGYIGTATNITRQKQDEFRLRESEDRYRTLVENSVLGIVVHADDRALFVNQAVANILGYGVEEIYALDALSDLFTDEARLVHQHYRDQRMRGEDVPNEYRTDCVRKDGEVVTIRQFSQVVEWEGRQAIQATMFDVTEQMRAEIATQESEQRLRLIADGLPVNIVYVDTDRRYRFVNNAYLAWYGQDADQILGRRVNEIMGEEAYALVRDRIDEALKGHQQNFELEIPFRFAGAKLVQVIYVPHLDDAGVVQGIYGLVLDVTERRQAEQAARDSEARLSRVLAIAPDAIIVADRHSRIRLFNRGAENVFGYSSDELLGQSVSVLMPTRYHDNHAAQVENFVVADGDSRMMSERAEIFGVRKDGVEFPAEASISKLRMGDEVMLTVMLHDISDRKKVEAELVEAKEKAEYADRAKSEFLANMSHELRTPLNAILGFSEMMKRETFGPLGNKRYDEYSAGIFESGDHLLSLINDILDISKIEAGRAELWEADLVVSEIIRDCMRLIETRAAEASLAVHDDFPRGAVTLKADERMIKQILLNLLSNAVRFTEAGGEIRIGGGVEADGSLLLQVADTGIGIAAEDIPKAISTFGQVDGALNRKFEGTGLGLPLAKSLVELHGGGFELESAVGKGTTVTVRFPRARVSAG